MPSRWCDSAQLRRRQIESGMDLTFNEVFKPTFIKLVSSLKPANTLEIGAGTGHLSAELSKSGFSVTALEPSKGMHEVATEVLAGTSVNLLNCSSFEFDNTNVFEVAISHLVAHVVEDLSHFLQSIEKQLAIGGHFIFSIPHPCFYNEYKKMFGTEYAYMTPMVKNISFTITKDPENEISEVPYHHRPLSVYINSLLKNGFTICDFDETFPDKEVQNKYGALWKNPRYCIFTCRKL